MTWELSLSYIFLWLLLALVLSWTVITERRARRGNTLELLLIRFPRMRHGAAVSHAPSSVGFSTELYERLLSFLPQIAIEFVVPPVGDELLIYLAVPRRHQRRTVREVTELLPDASVELSDHYAPWSDTGILRASYLAQHKPYAIPLKGAVIPTADPAASVMRTLSKLRPLGEAAVLQWIIRPAPVSIRHQLRQLSEQLHSGHASSFKELHEQFLVSGGTLPILEKKLEGPLFAVNCRILVSGQRTADTERIITDLDKEFRVMSGGSVYNELQLRGGRNVQKIADEYLKRSFNNKEMMILNATELSGLSHLPLTQ